MNPIANQFATLNEYLENEGLKCPICFEPYDLSDDAHTPVSITTCIHTICIECFKQNNIQLCGECRTPIQLKKEDARQHPLVVQLVTSKKTIWDLAHQFSLKASSSSIAKDSQSEFEKKDLFALFEAASSTSPMPIEWGNCLKSNYEADQNSFFVHVINNKPEGFAWLQPSSRSPDEILVCALFLHPERKAHLGDFINQFFNKHLLTDKTMRFGTRIEHVDV